MMNLMMVGTADTMRDTSEPWALVNYQANVSHDDMGKDYNEMMFREDSCSSSEDGMSVSASAVDYGDASTDATNITDLSTDDGNIEHGDNNDACNAAIGHTLLLPWFDVATHGESPLHYDRELKIDDGEKDKAGDEAEDTWSGTKAGATNTPAARAKRKCATQPHGCAAVRVGWDSQIPRWCKGSELSYLICEESFPSKDSAMAAKDAMKTAIANWKGVGAGFKEVKRYEPATVAVVYEHRQRSDHMYLANAFFPRAEPGELLLYPRIFAKDNAEYLANILSHEIGHILGLRHEFAHNREADDPSVRSGSEDPQSVMEYHEDLGKLQVTKKDLEGLKELYAYDQPVYKGLPVLDVSPKPDTFGERGSGNYEAKKLNRRLSC
ncbi:hypothetical protein V8C34DRAFT_274679 [Trichoderma compactum]